MSINVSNELDTFRCKIIQNDSGKFESRFPTLVVGKSDCVFTRDLEGTYFGINSAHGEGKIVLETQDPEERMKIISENVPFFYSDYLENPTTEYPYNPSGSEFGIAALCSDNGNHILYYASPRKVIFNESVSI